MERPGVCLLNGELVAEEEARVPALDRGLLYGDGLFETFRVYDGRPFALEEHWERMETSCRVLGMPPPPPDPAGLLRPLIEAGGLGDGVVRVTWTRGPDPRGPRPGPAPCPTLLAQVRPLPPGLRERQEAGVEARRVPWPLRARGLPLQEHKTLAYLPSVLALGRVPAGTEPLLETTEGHLSEGATANLFWVRGGRLLTPHPEAGCLPGIARALVMDLAEALGLPVEEGLFPASDLAGADEAFLTSSVVEVTPVVAVDGWPVGTGRPGPWTRRLQQAYRRRVRQALGEP